MGGGGGRGKARRKHGKERLDRYYHLAKEQGYRARSAFKLIQLAQRFSLFQRPRVPGVAAGSADAAIVDLCAAPGGWLQVCVKHAPVATRIVGVDLVPIKGIRGVETLTEDITRPSLPAKIKKLLQGADVWLVLHDGSPNMGTDWSIDAFNQNVLVLGALRTAALLLCEGGTFVSKVFRSQDYAALLFVLQTLFTRVHATKPLASRNVSAEIFVVCQGYKKPAVLDHRLFDPKSVFLTEGADAGAACVASEEAGTAERTAQEGRQEQQQQTRLQGGDRGGDYRGSKDDATGEDASPGGKHGEGDCLSLLDLDGGSIFGKGKKGLFAELVRQQARRHRNGEHVKDMRRVTVQEFFDTEEPASLLVLQAREVFFQEPPTALEGVVKAHALTTGEILRCLGDVQVLGKSELVAVLKWRFRVKKALLLQRRAVLSDQGKQASQQGEQSKAPEQQVGEKRGGPGNAKGAEQNGATEEASTEEGSRSEADSQEEEDDVEGELRRMGALVQRREEKRRKRIEFKEKQKELRLRLSRGSCLGAGESVGHHVDPDLFTLSSKTEALLEEASACVPAEDDLFQSDDEGCRKQQKGEVGGWMQDDNSSDGGGARESEEADTLSGEDAGEVSADEVDPIDCMEAELALGHRLQKLQQAQAGTETKEKKHTRRQKVRSEWAAELENFRDLMQAEAAAVLAQKARQGTESDGSDEEEEGTGLQGGGRSPGEVLDDDDNFYVSHCPTEDVNWTREDKSFSSRMTRSSCEAVEESRGRGVAGKKAKTEVGGSGRVERERTARWFRQPIFEGCEDEMPPPGFVGLRKAAAEVDGGAGELTLEKVVPRSDVQTSLVRQAKKRRRAGDVGVLELPDEAETDGQFTAISSEALVERGSRSAAAEDRLAGHEGDRVIAELDEDALPLIPVCDKRQQQQRRREQARKEQEKAFRRMKKMKETDNIDDDAVQEPNTSRLSRRSKGERLEEVPAFDIVGSSAVKTPSDPEELARIQTVGALLINRTSRMDLIDGAYNRYAFNDEQLPEWFVEEEKRHNKPQLPLTKELMRQYRQKLLDISRRPIRKVQEARARKKLREKRQLQKVKSQAVAIAESAEFTEAGKARAIEKIARKAGRVKEKSEKNYYVVSRGVRGGRTLVSKKKNTGNKCARTKFVDRRMKKDKRGQKNATNRKGRGGIKKPGKRYQRKS